MCMHTILNNYWVIEINSISTSYKLEYKLIENVANILGNSFYARSYKNNFFSRKPI